MNRDARATAVLDALARDTRHALRRLARDWRFTIAAVLILGLTIGANTAIFSVVNAVLFRRQALPAANRLVNIYQNDRVGRPLVVTTYAAYLEMAQYTDVFAATMASSIPSPARYLHDGAVRDGVVEFSTATYLDVLGLRPSLGRWFDEPEEQPGAPPVAVIGHQAWTTVFRADPSIVGRVIRIEGVPVTIVGVGPANHRGTIDVGLATDFWLPIPALPGVLANMFASSPRRDASTITAPLLVKARLREGVTLPQAKAAMDVLSDRLSVEYPDLFRREGELQLGKGITVVASTTVRVHPQADAPLMALASLVLVIAGLVLAIATSNLATMLLVRSAARAKEISVRLAMGAGRRQLVCQLLTESLLLSLAGGIAGCFLAWWSIQALQRVDWPVSVDFALDYRVLGFAFALSLVTGVAFGLAPALKATRIDLLSTLRDAGLPPIDHRRLSLKNALIVFQVTVSVLMLGGTSLFLQQAAAAKALRVGYAVDGVAMLETDLRFSGYAESRARTVFAELLQRIAAIPGVESAALLRGLPMAANTVGIVIDTARQTGSPVEAVVLAAGPGFFETLRIPLMYGRGVDTRDRADTPRVAVITDRLAQQYFGTIDAVGRRFRLATDADVWTEVIGVVRDTGTGRLGDDVLDPIAPPFYTSYTQTAALPTTVVARTRGDAAALLAAMQRELRAVDVPVMTAMTMAQHLEETRAAPAAVATLLGVLGVLGLVLASIGLYAVVAYAVARRTREIGIRMALGARSAHVVWSIARGMAGLVGIGTGIGLVLSVVAMLALRASSSTDIGIGNISMYRPNVDPVALLVIAAVTALVGVAAAFVPARQAVRMAPLAALRHE